MMIGVVLLRRVVSYTCLSERINGATGSGRPIENAAAPGGVNWCGGMTVCTKYRTEEELLTLYMIAMYCVPHVQVHISM